MPGFGPETSDHPPPHVLRTFVNIFVILLILKVLQLCVKASTENENTDSQLLLLLDITTKMSFDCGHYSPGSPHSLLK